jgi:hypothetical protein
MDAATMPNRIYEGVCEPYGNEPTRDRFLIVDTNDKGEGVMALVGFKPGDVVFKFHGQIVKTQSLMTLQIEKGKRTTNYKLISYLREFS